MLYHHFFLTLLLSVSFICYSIANDPIQELLDNPQITWAAEVYTIYAPHASHYEPFISNKIEGKNLPSILKIQNSASDNFLEIPSGLAHYLLNLKEDNLKVFKDSKLSQQISFKNYNKITTSSDTVETFDVNTFKKINQIVTKKHDYQNIHLFKVKQILYYNSKTHFLGLLPIAIAPILEGEDLFWIPIQEVKKSLDLNATSIVWAQRIVRDIPQKDLTIIKGKQSLGEIVLELMGQAILAPEFSKLYYTTTPLEIMPSEIVKNINTGESEITANQITQIRIVQDWFWNHSQQEMSFLLQFYAPILIRYDDIIQKNLENTLFYQKPE